MNPRTHGRLPKFPSCVDRPGSPSVGDSFLVGQRLVLSSTFAGVGSSHPQSGGRKVSSSFKSQSIPITSGMKRTPSEVQLHEDEEQADFRDYVMFTRIVGRLARQQHETKDYRLRQENDMCLAHFIGTRNGSRDLPDPIIKESFQPNSYHQNQQMLAEIQDMLLDEDDEDDAMFKLDL